MPTTSGGGARRRSPTRRQSQRPGLSRLVLRAARAAPAPVVAHLERWAKKNPAAIDPRFKMNTPDMKHYRSRDSHSELDVPRSWNSFPPVLTNSPSELIRFASDAGASPLLII